MPETPHPLLMAEAPWRNIFMDLFTRLPMIEDYDVVWTVVDLFSKEIVVFETTTAITAQQLALQFRNQIWSQHGTL